MVFTRFRDTIAIIHDGHTLLNVELHFSHDIEGRYVDQQKKASWEDNEVSTCL
jgi:hypothetical protein